jgi:hypothetical protein
MTCDDIIIIMMMSLRNRAVVMVMSFDIMSRKNDLPYNVYTTIWLSLYLFI